jgi:uncharacterized protein (UPF0332 family)
MNPRDFLDVADELIGGLKEAEWRSAISRAYYAAFQIARQLLLHCGFTVPPDQQAHTFLWLRLANSGHPDVQTAGSDLGELRTARNKADYDLDRSLSHSTGAHQFQTALDIIQILELVAADEVIRGRVTEGIKQYERDVLRQITWRG